MSAEAEARAVRRGLDTSVGEGRCNSRFGRWVCLADLVKMFSEDREDFWMV